MEKNKSSIVAWIALVLAVVALGVVYYTLQPRLSPSVTTTLKSTTEYCIGYGGVPVTNSKAVELCALVFPYDLYCPEGYGPSVASIVNNPTRGTKCITPHGDDGYELVCKWACTRLR